MSKLFSGFLMMASLIIGFGPQNLHVLRCGIRKQNVTGVVLVCIIGELFFLILGGLLLHYLMVSHRVEGVFTKISGLILIYYAVGILHSEQSKEHQESQKGEANPIFEALVVTFLNPLVVLDTVFMMGVTAHSFDSYSKWLFLIGGAMMSISWYCGLGYGSNLVSSWFVCSKKQRVMDYFVAVILLFMYFRI